MSSEQLAVTPQKAGSVGLASERGVRILARLRNRMRGAADSFADASGHCRTIANTRLRPQGATPGQAGLLLPNTGWTDEARAASLASSQAKARLRAKEREWMFEGQRKDGGKYFIENWYPRGGGWGEGGSPLRRDERGGAVWV